MASKISLRLGDDFLERIDREADEHGMNRSEYIRQCTREGLYKDIIGDPSDEESGEMSYKIELKTENYEVVVEADGFCSMDDMDRDRKEALDSIIKYVEDRSPSDSG